MTWLPLLPRLLLARS
jgi:ABC-type uncharacterized transport system substrate-binding protein